MGKEAFKMGTVYVVMAVLVAVLLDVSVAYTMSDLCQYWYGTGYVGNPDDCQGWGYCENNVLTDSGTCPTGYVYNSPTATCNNESKTVCATNLASTCKAVQTATYAPVQANCSQYAYCDGKGTLTYGSCPVDQYYSASDIACVWGPQCPQGSVCSYMKNNRFVGDPLNECTSDYLMCYNGSATVGTCSNNYYNYETGYCTTTLPSYCSDTGIDNDDSTLPAATTTKLCATATVGSYVADGATCFGYYYCESTTLGKWGRCPQGLHYNDQKCVSPVSFACTFNRCGNLNVEFVSQVGNDCQQYKNCNSGKIGVCPAGHAYFNEPTGECVETALSYPICT